MYAHMCVVDIVCVYMKFNMSNGAGKEENSVCSEWYNVVNGIVFFFSLLFSINCRFMLEIRGIDPFGDRSLIN